MTEPLPSPADRPDVLICAGLDPSGGAGILADVRVVADHGCRPVGVVTALTVQNTTAVIATEAVGADLVREQLEFLLSDVEVKAVKIGMIGSSDVARAIASALALTRAPVVWDPIVHPSRGDVRLIDSLGQAMTSLLPHVSLLTPNAGELAILTGAPIASLEDAIAAGSELASRLGIAVLVKGGHLGAPRETSPSRASAGELVSVPAKESAGSTVASLVESTRAAAESTASMAESTASPAVASKATSKPESAAESIDVLCHAGKVEQLRGPRIAGGEHVHGTGCALSSAIAAQLALGAELIEAIRSAKAYVAARIAEPAQPGRGARAIV